VAAWVCPWRGCGAFGLAALQQDGGYDIAPDVCGILSEATMSMLVTMLKAKLRRATVTGADMDYEGSIGIDRDLLDPPASCRTSRSTS
jgi:hypothetical protein